MSKYIDSSGVDFECDVRFRGGVDLSTATAITGTDVILTLPRVSLFGSGQVHRIVSPYAGTIVKVWSVLDGEVITTGNATLTASIAGVGVTNGVITIALAGTVLGDVDSCTPTALNTVTAGQAIVFTTGGTNASEDARSTLTIVIRRSA